MFAWIRSKMESTRARLILFPSALYGLLTLAMDGTVVAVAGWLLWATAGPTVAEGAIPGQVGFVLVIVCGVAARSLLARRVRFRFPATTPALPVVGLAVSLVLDMGLVVLWVHSQLYYLGWLGLLGVAILLVDSLLRFLLAVAVPTRQDGQHPGRISLVSATVGLGASAAGIICTAQIHEWNGSLMNNLILLIAVGVLLGHLATAVIGQLVRRSLVVSEQV